VTELRDVTPTFNQARDKGRLLPTKPRCISQYDVKV